MFMRRCGAAQQGNLGSCFSNHRLILSVDHPGIPFQLGRDLFSDSMSESTAVAVGHSWASSPVQCSVLQEPLSNRRATGGRAFSCGGGYSSDRLSVAAVRNSYGWTFTDRHRRGACLLQVLAPALLDRRPIRFDQRRRTATDKRREATMETGRAQSQFQRTTDAAVLWRRTAAARSPGAGGFLSWMDCSMPLILSRRGTGKSAWVTPFRHDPIAFLLTP